MIPAFERAKTVHALDHAATVIGSGTNLLYDILKQVIMRMQNAHA
jgi:hypothetical protein